MMPAVEQSLVSDWFQLILIVTIILYKHRTLEKSEK